MKNMKRFMPLAVLSLMSGFTSCEEESYELGSAELMYSIEISMTDENRAKIYVDDTNTETLPLIVGESIQLGFVSNPADLSELTYKELVWESSDAEVVTIDDTGKITAKAVGTAIVTVSPATVNLAATSSVKITVVGEVTKVTAITITDDSTHQSEHSTLPSCYEEETMTLTASVSPAEATYKTVLWSSRNEDIATIDPVTGVVTGVAMGEAVLVATALDEDHVTAEYKIYIDKLINPEGIRILNAPSADDVFSVGDGNYQIDFETYPEISTKSRVNWTTSDPSVATVQNGKVSFLKYGSVDITASVDAEAEHDGYVKTQTMRFNIPAGFYREHFTDNSLISWNMATSGGTQEWKTSESDEAYIYFTPNKANSSTLRGDVKRTAPTYLTQDYPILCFRIDDVNDSGYARNITLDTSGNVEDGTKFSGGIGYNNNKWKTKYKCSDGSAILIYDLATQGFGKSDGTNLLPTGTIGTFSTFQLKYADIKLPDNADYSEDPAVHYRMFWFHTFRSENELNAYLQEWSKETEITYE